MRQLIITKSITNREIASVDKYLQDIGKEELITAEEEAELARRIKQGDHNSLEKLTKANLRFVVSVAISILFAGAHQELTRCNDDHFRFNGEAAEFRFSGLYGFLIRMA